MADFPADAVPENRLPQVSALCSLGILPYVMTGLLRQLLADHFSSADNIEDPRIRDRLEEIGTWRPNQDGQLPTGLEIESLTKWQPNSAMLRPSLLIRRNKWDWESIIIPNAANIDNLETGAVQYMGLWNGSHTIFAMARQPATAELLATEAMQFLMRFQLIIANAMNLARFVPASLDGLHQVQEASDCFAVPLTVAYAVESIWTVEAWSPRLKRINFAAEL